jgi:hypothetical protein
LSKQMTPTPIQLLPCIVEWAIIATIAMTVMVVVILSPIRMLKSTFRDGMHVIWCHFYQMDVPCRHRAGGEGV